MDMHTKDHGVFEALTGVLHCSQACEAALGARCHLPVDSDDDLKPKYFSLPKI